MNGATDSTTTLITVLYKVDGTILNTNDGHNEIYVQSHLGLGNATADTIVQTLNYTNPTVTAAVSYGFGAGSGFSTVSNGLLVFEGTFALQGASETLGISQSLNVLTQAGGVADFSNTGQVSFILPTGVSFTSASGVFLQSASVPEPSSFVLLGIGAVGLIHYGRRRAKLRQAA